MDFIEVYSGEAVLSRRMKLAGFSVGPPIELKEGWNMLERDLFQFLLALSRAGRLGFTWLGPPCTTFSLARAARLRSRESPWGLDPLEEECCVGGLHMRQSLALFCSQLNSGALQWWRHHGEVMRVVFRFGIWLSVRLMRCGLTTVGMGSPTSNPLHSSFLLLVSTAGP